MDIYINTEMATELPIPYTKDYKFMIIGMDFFSFHLPYRVSVVSESCECLKNSKQ